jgi:biopolymer transport protein ExbB/TolQ
MYQHLADFFREGGPFMFVNLLFSGVALAIVVERVIALVFRLNVNASSLLRDVQQLVSAGEVKRAADLCKDGSGAALPRVLHAGLSRAGQGEAEVSRALEEAVMEVTPLVSKRIASLWSLANIATLVGLIGTIVGLIGTFKSLGAASPEMKQVMLSKGISEAMNNTAFGLVIAVTCIVAHLLLTSKSKAMVEEIEFGAVRLENMLSRQAANDPAVRQVEARGA